jgi:hypothetical protein
VIPSLNNEIIKNGLNVAITYLLSSEILRRMINSNNSSLTMEYNEKNKEALDPLDMIKVYWSFYWRESLIELGVVLVLGIIGFFILRGSMFISFIPVVIILLISLLVLSYYIGRYVFRHVISSVWWSIGRIEITLEE